MEDINVQELKSKLENKEDFVFIDVREPHENESDNLGGQLIPLGDIPVAVPRLLEHKDQEVVIYCRSGARSGRAKEYLVQNFGFTNVRNVLGGILAYREMEK